MEWQDRLITTNVDKLLKYLAREGEASIEEAADDLDVTEAMIEIWASALEESELIEKSYSTRKGTILKPNMDKMREKMDEFRDSARDEIKEAEGTMDRDDEDLQEAKESLRKLIDALDEQAQANKHLENVLEEIKEEETHLAEELEKSDDVMEANIFHILDEIDDRIGTAEHLEDEINEFRQRKKNVEDDIKALNILQEAYREHRQATEEDEPFELDIPVPEDNSCIVCGKQFKNTKGVKVHQSKMHTESELASAIDEHEESNGFFTKLKNLFS